MPTFSTLLAENLSFYFVFFFFVQSHDWSQCMSLIGRNDYHDTHADHLVMAGFNAMPLLAKVKL